MRVMKGRSLLTTSMSQAFFKSSRQRQGDSICLSGVIYPGPMPTVDHGDDVIAFLGAAARLDAKVVYLVELFGRDGSLLAFQAGFALHGVLHEIAIGDDAPYELDPVSSLYGPLVDHPRNRRWNLSPLSPGESASTSNLTTRRAPLLTPSLLILGTRGMVAHPLRRWLTTEPASPTRRIRA